ncbi:hypothetical protein ACFOG5_18055 [Pedobacter fastidiosus]|uniref:Uncharacterized protein n=1 Tax=Pedobacter fastidiosus TaxID=2765361 RepID=A0ABR7KSB4_9SPHI|nr:hypothetical protein [Pedobacter fastidiosus]MBC6110988.1 hypothetical protein [Pedobacter fastidiosus]
MNTKYLMIASSIFLGLIGLVCTFAASEILIYFRLEESEIFELIIQILGALYLGFTLLNWTARANLIGGIYSKPVSLGNFLHFVTGGITLAKYFSKYPTNTILIVPTAIYLIFAIAFGLVSFGRHEFKKQA